MTRALSIASLHSSLKVYDLESPGRVGLLGHWRSIGLSESSWPAREIQEAYPLSRSQVSLDFERFIPPYTTFVHYIFLGGVVVERKRTCQAVDMGCLKVITRVLLMLSTH